MLGKYSSFCHHVLASVCLALNMSFRALHYIYFFVFFAPGVSSSKAVSPLARPQVTRYFKPVGYKVDNNEH